MKSSSIRKVFYFLPFACYMAELILWAVYDGDRCINGVLGALWFAGQAGIITILLSLSQERVTGDGKLRMTGIWIAFGGAICYMLNYVLGYWLELNTRILLPAGALLSGIGMLVTGIQTLRSNRWDGWKRFAPLIVGLYPFAIMFPVLLITGHPSIPAIMMWGVPWFILGVAVDENPD